MSRRCESIQYPSYSSVLCGIKIAVANYLGYHKVAASLKSGFPNDSLSRVPGVMYDGIELKD